MEALASLAKRPLPFRAAATMPLPTNPYNRAMERKLSVASLSDEPSSYDQPTLANESSAVGS